MSETFYSDMTDASKWNQALDLGYTEFCHYAPIARVREILSESDRKISLVASINNIVIGAYFLRRIDLFNSAANGLEGLGLTVRKDYQGLGVGRHLISQAGKTIDIDYIWGIQLKSLNNIESWLKRRILIDELSTTFITGEALTERGRSLILTKAQERFGKIIGYDAGDASSQNYNPQAS